MGISTISICIPNPYNETYRTFFLQAKVVTALIDFTPLWETMRRKQVTQYQLLKNGLDNKTLDTLKKNRNITLSTLEKLCQMLDCTPNDVVQFIPDDKK